MNCSSSAARSDYSVNRPMSWPYLQAGNRQLKLQLQNSTTQALENFPVLTNVYLFTAHRAALINAGKQIGLAMYMYADDHGGTYPTNFEQIVLKSNSGNGYLGTNFSGDIGLNDFEMANSGLASGQFPEMPVVKERQPRWWDGRWERVYVLADGSVQLITSDNGDFTAWEKKRMASASGTTNQ